MFYPQEMSELEIIVPTKDLLPITKILSGQGVFSQTDVNYLSSDKEKLQPDQWQEKASSYSLLERRLFSILSSLGVLKSKPQQITQESLVDIGKTQLMVDDIEKKVKGAVEQINSETKKIEHFNNLLQQVEPLSDIDLDFSQLQNSRYLYSILGMMPVENIDRLKTSLSRIPFEIYILSQKQQKAVVWLAASRESADVLDRAARSAYLDPIHLPTDYKGTPSLIAQELHNSVSTSEAAIKELKSQLEIFRKEYEDQLQTILWDVRCSHMTVNAILRYGRLKYTYIIVGWIFTSAIPNLKEKIKAISHDVVIETRSTKRDKESTEVPTALNNPSLLRPFQMLVTTYADPRYNELDPTPLVAILFPLMFGTMFGDVGHGLILSLLGGLIVSKKVKAFKGLASLGPIVLACGITSMIFGFLYGSIFGFEEFLHPLWMQPGKNIMSILIITIVAGVIVLSLGFLLNIYNLIKVRDWPIAIFSHNGIIGLFFYWSLIGFGVSQLAPTFHLPKIPFMIAAILGVVGIMLSEVFIRLMEGHRPLIDGGIGTYIVQIFFELIEILISFLSNSLSFVRVGAFAVAHGNLSGVFFVLGSMVSPNKGIGYWIMFLVGLVFIVGFEGLIVGIQTMRLTYYEIFGKFFNGGGRRFEPLKLHPAENE